MQQSEAGIFQLHVQHALIDGIVVVAIGGFIGADLVQRDIVASDALDLHQLGLHNHNIRDEVGVVVVHIDLDQSAVVGVVGDVGNLLHNAHVLTVNGKIGCGGGFAVLGGLKAVQAQSADLGSVRGALDVVGNLGGVGVIGLNGEGADGNLLVAPLVGGTAEVVNSAALALHAQIFEVLLAELNSVVVVDVGVAGVADLLVVDVSGVVLVAGDVGADLVAHDGGVAGDDVEAAGVLDHSGLQGVQGQLAGLFAVHGLGAVEAQAVEQAGGVAQLGHVHGPAGAGEALKVALVAQRAQQHLGKGEAGQGVGGLEGAVAVAADVTSRLAVADDARKGVARGNVGGGRIGIGQRAGRLGADHQRDDDLRGSAAGQFGLGTEGTVVVTGDDADPIQNGNRFLVLNLILVGEILVLGGSGADGDQGHGHDQCQNQGQEFLHRTFLLLRLRSVRAFGAPSRIRVGASRSHIKPGIGPAARRPQMQSNRKKTG